MAVGYKIVKMGNPMKPQEAKKYYPRLVTQGKFTNLDEIAYRMKEASSLSLGDIKSVLANFTECMRTSLYNGESVRIADFGTFSLNAQVTGEDTEKASGVKNIKVVNIRFRAATSLKPNLSSTRASERIKFINIKTGVEELKDVEIGDTTIPGGGDGGGNDDDYIDPGA